MVNIGIVTGEFFWLVIIFTVYNLSWNDQTMLQKDAITLTS